MENQTVRHGRAKSGEDWGSQGPRVAVRHGLLSRRRVLMPVLAAHSIITNRLGKRNPTVGCVRRSVCVQNRGVFSTVSPKALRRTHRRWGGLTKPMGIAGTDHLCQTNCRGRVTTYMRTAATKREARQCGRFSLHCPHGWKGCEPCQLAEHNAAQSVVDMDAFSIHRQHRQFAGGSAGNRPPASNHHIG